jgi:hypothetical protein
MKDVTNDFVNDTGIFEKKGKKESESDLKRFVKLNITDTILDKLGFSEYQDEHGTWGGRTLTFSDGTRFRIIPDEFVAKCKDVNMKPYIDAYLTERGQNE